MAKIELDVSVEIPLREVLVIASDYSLSMRVVKLIGPAGGNPLVEFSGNREDLIKYINEYYFDDPEFYISLIEG